jgi:hypothetical protein
MAQSGEPAEKKQKLDTEIKFDFTDAAAVRALAGDSERLVCLKLPEGLGSLYCHSCFLSFSSPVLRNAMDDTQQREQQAGEDQLCTIPLAGDSDLGVWQLALGLIYRLDSAVITLGNAQALLLLAHKYDLRRITGEPTASTPPPPNPTYQPSRALPHMAGSPFHQHTWSIHKFVCKPVNPILNLQGLGNFSAAVSWHVAVLMLVAGKGTSGPGWLNND